MIKLTILEDEGYVFKEVKTSEEAYKLLKEYNQNPDLALFLDGNIVEDFSKLTKDSIEKAGVILITAIGVGA